MHATFAEGDPQSNGAAESSVNVVKRQVKSIKLAAEPASVADMPADRDLLTLLVPYATSMHFGFRLVEMGRQNMKEMWEGVCWHTSVSEFGGCLFAAIQPSSGLTI